MRGERDSRRRTWRGKGIVPDQLGSKQQTSRTPSAIPVQCNVRHSPSGMTWNAPLVVATFVFVLFLLWRFRPAFGGAFGSTGGRGKGAVLRAAKQRVEGAKTDDERAVALCDAGDAAASGLTGSDSAIGYYLRAMRPSPRPPRAPRPKARADPLSRARGERKRGGGGLARSSRRPARRALRAFALVRGALGAEPWRGGGEAAARAALDELARLYAGPLRNAPRARAMENAKALLT